MRKLLVLVVLICAAGLASGNEIIYPSFMFDSLRNTSCLSNEQLRYYFEYGEEDIAAKVIDRDGDGFEDSSGIEIWEFLARMEIILQRSGPFEYKGKAARYNRAEPEQKEYRNDI